MGYGRFFQLLQGVSFTSIDMIHCNQKESQAKELAGVGRGRVAPMPKLDDDLMCVLNDENVYTSFSSSLLYCARSYE
jgi:hypothetical protein